MSETTSKAARSAGRPRDTAVEQRLLSASLDELAARGYGGFSLESVARRAKTAKTTLYRRYQNKAELVIAAVGAAFETANPLVPNQGKVREDLATLLTNTALMLTETPTGAAFRAIIPVLHEDPKLSEMAKTLEHERRKLIAAVLQEGMDAGQITTRDLDPLIDSLLGAIYLRYLVLQMPIDAEYVQHLIATVLAE